MVEKFQIGISRLPLRASLLLFNDTSPRWTAVGVTAQLSVSVSGRLTGPAVRARPCGGVAPQILSVLVCDYHLLSATPGLTDNYFKAHSLGRNYVLNNKN